ncbi:unnamed protein product [Owenia fusiformis]|uniref:Septin n=1 Tax=Owenia fusiformis TaxID=6347 RepID=A0A8J1UTP5_OWEFU|nr:unnamed protein product [Owenia fusiformis]
MSHVSRWDTHPHSQGVHPHSRSSRRRLSKLSYDPEPEKNDEDVIGFATLPDQVHRKAVRRGFDFTLMVVGESGLGKSTLVSSLFLTDLYKDKKTPDVEDKISKTVEIEKKYMEIEEKGVKLRLTIVDTPGFNDAVNANECWKPVAGYIDQQFEQYFKDESGLNRRNIKDHRVHCCLYFISPYGHGLRQVDIEFMKQLHHKVNIVPIIAKADTLTTKEIHNLKLKILEEVEKHKIEIYEFPECDSDEDEEFKQQDTDLKSAIPFAVIGSNTVLEVNGKKVRGRMYPWGIVEVDNPIHCDFGKLRQMLISTHMQDLKDVTRDIHYENFRAINLADKMKKDQKDRNKLKRDSSPNFDQIVATDSILAEKDEEIRRMQEMLAKMQEQLNVNKKSAINGHGLHNL